MPLTVGDVTSLSERSRAIKENDESSAASHIPEVVSTPEVVSGHVAAALRSLTSPTFHDVIMATGPLLFPHPFWHPPVLSLSDLASYYGPGALPEIARPWNGGADHAIGSGSGSVNGSSSCDEDVEDAGCAVVATTSPLDLSPPRTERQDNFSHHGNKVLAFDTHNSENPLLRTRGA